MIRIFLVLPFITLVVYSIFSVVKYPRMIGNIFLSLVYTPSQDSFASVKGERVSILDSSDQEIEAVYVQGGSSDRVVIFCHESGASKDSWEKYAGFLAEAGCHVVSFDFLEENSNDKKINSLSQWPVSEDVDRLVTVIRWAKRAIKPEPQVILFGVSKGANVALAASFREGAVKALVTDGLFSMKEIFRDYIRKWAPILVKPNLFGENYPKWVVDVFSQLGYWNCEKRTKKEFVDVEALLKKKHKPLIMIHGENDDYVSKTHQAFLRKIESIHGPAHHPIVSSAGHNEAIVLQRALYEREVRNFLDKVLKP